MAATLLESRSASAIQIDLVLSKAAQNFAHHYALFTSADASLLPLSSIVNPLIIDEHGQMLPFSYGVNSRFAISSQRAGLAEQIAEFKSEGSDRARHLLEATFERLDEQPAVFIDWFHHLVKTSYELVLPAMRS